MLAAPGAAVEAERGGKELAAESARLELRRDRVDTRDLVLQIRVADDDPLEAERIGLAVECGARPLGDAPE
jgi:hypothetical protein